ncbi:uncharacterized protein A1O9_12746 [Exophiala aquamarina CBS 119918]|uniref:Heterokaryon incompatibility domain-containing protein n=1 Tax=Exophiala aquamarina CBS 119918 TaxID=1182545 RepID=A0A072NUR4_9EURO|nr:uncharacterized protein A1O9_12746 [Exophiala aquamarina CBS 119918]KEF51132.1 hypothetical protein A1O9_12746 [Exophiala aquamarina CBS 119918]
MSALPRRLLGHNDRNFYVFDPRSHGVSEFHIISYTWGGETQPYNCGIEGVSWDVKTPWERIKDIQRLMIAGGVQYIWVDSLCINQADENERSAEISKMYEYYSNADTCHILLGMTKVWDPQVIVNNLHFVDHILAHMGGAALASEAPGLTTNSTRRLAQWENDEKWAFPVVESTVRAAAIDMGVLNCYATCVSHVKSMFDNPYFFRVWTFQEMILGKNITMWGINQEKISEIGKLSTWMDLAIDSQDKAVKLLNWIRESRALKTASVNTILRFIEEDCHSLDALQTQVKGISSARTDIINGGPSWWHGNHKGVSNIFSAVSITPRKCLKREDIFKGLLGIFSGLFTPEEIKQEMSGNDIERISFNFFKRLSTRTGRAWTKLAISSGERGNWDWIPVVENPSVVMTTDCFAGVVNMGFLGQKGQAKARAMTGVSGVPRQYMSIRLNQDNRGFQFTFQGCNCGKKVKTGHFSSELIPTYDQPRDVVKDESGRVLVQVATILGSVMDPGGDIIEYRRRLLSKLQPDWKTNDPSAKPTGWEDRCVSGTDWENPNFRYIRTHNWSMNYRMVDIKGCETRLHNESTANISCEVRVNCGCTIVAPFSLMFEAITAVFGSFLGKVSGELDDDDRIILKDGLGLVQVGDIGRTFKLVAFGGDVNAHKSYARSCRRVKQDKAVHPTRPWPSGRALVREEFSHGITDGMRNYGYVGTGGSGNLLICRNNPIGQYKIIGVCIDDYIPFKKDEGKVNIR